MQNRFFLSLILFLPAVKIFFAEAYSDTPPSSAQVVFTATINAAQEGSPDKSHATATAWAVLSGDRTQLTYQITYAHLTSASTASHFHLGFPGVNGPVIQPIQYHRNTAQGVWMNLPDTIVSSLMRGKIYIDIHSKNYPGGEIRGQLKPASGIPFTISLDAKQVGGVDLSTASGTGWALLTANGSATSLTYGMTIAGIGDAYTASHFHLGYAGQNGALVEPFSFNDSSSYGVWSGISDLYSLALIRNGFYVNIHSSNYFGGEIRGQVMETGPISFTASLDGSQETPAVTTSASGTAWFVLSSDFSSLAYNITYARLQGSFSASHFHLGLFGVAGSVVEPINTYKGNSASGTWNGMPDSLLAALIKGSLYVNLLSSVHSGGEIRGQVWLNTGTAFFTTLTSGQSVPPLVTSGSGTAWISYLNDTLKSHITIAGLTSAFSASHFHLGAKGTNGGVVHPISFLSESTAADAWSSFDDASLVALMKGGLYINVYTSLNPGGEIRGQVLPSDIDEITSLTSVEEKPASVPLNYELSQNYPNPFNPSTTINYSLPKSGFVTIKVYNILGKEVATLVNGQLPAGNYRAIFDGNDNASGVYFYRMTTEGASYTKKLILMR